MDAGQYSSLKTTLIRNFNVDAYVYGTCENKDYIVEGHNQKQPKPNRWAVFGAGVVKLAGKCSLVLAV